MCAALLSFAPAVAAAAANVSSTAAAVAAAAALPIVRREPGAAGSTGIELQVLFAHDNASALSAPATAHERAIEAHVARGLKRLMQLDAGAADDTTLTAAVLAAVAEAEAAVGRYLAKRALDDDPMPEVFEANDDEESLVEAVDAAADDDSVSFPSDRAEAGDEGLDVDEFGEFGEFGAFGEAEAAASGDVAGTVVRDDDDDGDTDAGEDAFADPDEAEAVAPAVPKAAAALPRAGLPIIPPTPHYSDPTYDADGNELKRIAHPVPRTGALELWSEEGFMGHKALYGREAGTCDTLDRLTYNHHGFGKSAMVTGDDACCILYSRRGCTGQKLVVGSRLPTLEPYAFADKTKSVYCMRGDACTAYYKGSHHKVHGNVKQE